ncbi:hypothetical protein [Flavobacterium sp.]
METSEYHIKIEFEFFINYLKTITLKQNKNQNK